MAGQFTPEQSAQLQVRHPSSGLSRIIEADDYGSLRYRLSSKEENGLNQTVCHDKYEVMLMRS